MDATTENIDHLSKVSEISCDVDAGNCHRLSHTNLSGIFLCNYVSAPNFKACRAPYWRHSEPRAHLNKLWKPCASGDKSSTNMPGRRLLHLWNHRRLFSKREWLDWLSLGCCGRIHGISYVAGKNPSTSSLSQIVVRGGSIGLRPECSMELIFHIFVCRILQNFQMGELFFLKLVRW